MCAPLCLGKTCGATLAFLMHVNDFGYKLQSLYFFFLLTTEYEKKRRKTQSGRGKSSQQLLSLGSQSQLLQIWICFCFCQYYCMMEIESQTSFGRKWHLFHSCKLKLKRGKDVASVWERERENGIAGRILKLICMPGLLAYQLGNQSAVASRDRYFD